MTLDETQSACAVVEWSYGIESSCTLKIEYNQRCFYVTLSIDQAPDNTVEKSLLQKLDSVQVTGDDEEIDEVLRKLRMLCV